MPPLPPGSPKSVTCHLWKGEHWWQLLRPYIIHISQLIIYTNWHAQGGAPCAMYHNRLVAQINIVGIVTTFLCIWIFHASPNLVLANIPLQRVWHISHWICCYCCAFIWQMYQYPWQLCGRRIGNPFSINDGSSIKQTLTYHFNKCDISVQILS